MWCYSVSHTCLPNTDMHLLPPLHSSNLVPQGCLSWEFCPEFPVTVHRSLLHLRHCCWGICLYDGDVEWLGHVFVDFKKAFDRVWHAALWATMNLYNINGNLIKLIQNLYNKATSAVYLNNSIGDWFRTTVGVRQGCVL